MTNFQKVKKFMETFGQEVKLRNLTGYKLLNKFR